MRGGRARVRTARVRQRGAADGAAVQLPATPPARSLARPPVPQRLPRQVRFIISLS